MKITDYLFVSDVDAGDFAVKVAELLSEGYQPLGSISMTSCVAHPMPNVFIAYAQAMVKYASIHSKPGHGSQNEANESQTDAGYCNLCQHYHPGITCL